MYCSPTIPTTLYKWMKDDFTLDRVQVLEFEKMLEAIYVNGINEAFVARSENQDKPEEMFNLQND